MADSIRERLQLAREHADSGGVPMRRTDKALYALLAECLGICEDVARDGLLPELREAVRVTVDIRGQNNAGKGRRFAFKDADVYTLVARAVLEGADNRNSVYRYAGALRCAGERQIRSVELEAWLATHGGVVTLYETRQRPDIERSTKTVVLDQPIKYKVGVPITITIEATSAGRFRLR